MEHGQATIAPVKVTVGVTHQLLPRCGTCHERHPLAFPLSAKVDPDTCPGCGSPAAEPGQPSTEYADLTDAGRTLAEVMADSRVMVNRRGRFGVHLIRLGNALKALAKRIAPDA